MKLELTEQEGQALLNLVDVAVKSLGLSAAASGVFFFEKITKAFQAEKQGLHAVEDVKVPKEVKAG